MKGHLSFLSENGLGAILIVNIVIAGSLGSDAPLKALQKSAGGRGRGGGLVAGRRLLYTPPFLPSSLLPLHRQTSRWLASTYNMFQGQYYFLIIFVFPPLSPLETDWIRFQGVN